MKIQGQDKLSFPLRSITREERAAFALPETPKEEGDVQEAVQTMKASMEGLSAQDAVRLHSVARQIRMNTYEVGGEAIAEHMLKGLSPSTKNRP